MNFNQNNKGVNLSFISLTTDGTHSPLNSNNSVAIDNNSSIEKEMTMKRYGLMICNYLFIIAERAINKDNGTQENKWFFETTEPITLTKTVREKDGKPEHTIQITKRFISIPMDSETKCIQACLNFATKHNLLSKKVEELTGKDVQKVEAPVIERKPFARQPFANPALISEILAMNIGGEKPEEKPVEEKPVEEKKSKKNKK